MTDQMNPIEVLREALTFAPDTEAFAALAQVETLIQAARELLPYAQLDDPWGSGVERAERYRARLNMLRGALAPFPQQTVQISDEGMISPQYRPGDLDPAHTEEQP